MFKRQDNHLASSRERRLRVGLLACFALTASSLTPVAALAQDADFTPYQATTYGRASGDLPMPGFGLILELVGGDTPRPSLRLFGGIPGNHASIVISGLPGHAEDGRGNITLVGGQPAVISGQFDGRGRFELDLGALPAGSSQTGVFYAQGTQTGAISIDPSDGPTFELSNGVSFKPASSVEAELALVDFLPHLPVDRGPDVLGALVTGDIEQTVRAALNSANDSIALKLEGNGTGGAGANGGMKIEFEVEIKRTEDGRYELTVAQEAAATAGLELTGGIEGEAAFGVGTERVFRFESIEGALYGVNGIALALTFPRLAPGKHLMESGIVADGFEEAQAAFNELQQRMQLAEMQVEQARALFTYILDCQLGSSLSFRNSAHAAYLRAYSAYHGAYWKTWHLTAELVRTYAVYLAANVRYIATRVACDAARLALSAADTVAEGVRQMVRDAAQELSRLGRIVWLITQMRPYATDHFIGTELYLTGGIEAKVELPVKLKGGDKLPGAGAGASAEIKRENKIRWEHARAGLPLRIGVSRHFEIKGAAQLSLIIGGKVEGARTFELEDAFSISDQGVVEHTSSTAAIGSDVCVAGSLGIPVGEGLSGLPGLGRSWSVKMQQDELLTLIGQLGIVAVLEDPQAAVQSIAATNVEFTLQDRLEAKYEGKVEISALGTGGGAGGSLTWKDQGDLLKIETTLGEAAGNLSTDLLEMVEPLAQAANEVLN